MSEYTTEPERVLESHETIEHGDTWQGVSNSGPCLFTVGMTAAEAIENFPWFQKFVRPSRRVYVSQSPEGEV